MSTKKYFNVESINNVKNLNATTKKAKADVKARSFMYYVNDANKMAKKNEWCNNTNVRDLQNALKEATGFATFVTSVFPKDYERRSCLVKAYKGAVTAEALKEAMAHGETLTNDKGHELILSADGQAVRALVPIACNTPAVLDAYKAIIMPAAREADSTARAKVREEKKQARAALRSEKKQAQAAYNRGAITFAQYSAIMAKAI